MLQINFRSSDKKNAAALKKELKAAVKGTDIQILDGETDCDFIFSVKGSGKKEYNYKIKVSEVKKQG